jgi:phage antirepressor YoqD-like protein
MGSKVYSYRDKNGKMVYSDQPPLPDNVGPASNTNAGAPQVNPALKQVNTPGQIVYAPNKENEKANEEKTKEANKLISEIQKRVPKAKYYMETLEYLRSANPQAYAQAVDELQKTNPQAWIKIQQALKNSSVPTEKGLASVASVINNHSTENIVDQLISKWGRSAQKALQSPTGSTIAEPVPHVYSDKTTFGIHMAKEAPAAESAAKNAAVAARAAESAKLGAATTAFSRVGGVAVSAIMGAADKQVWDGSANIRWELSLRKLLEKGKITEEEYSEYHNMLGPQRYREVIHFIEAANKR